MNLTITITPDDLDGGYVASVAEMPGCLSQGETIGEACANIGDAIESVQEVLASR